MRRTRFSIAGLMGFVMIVAVGVAGLKASSPLWASACYSLTLLTLAAGILVAIQSRGRSQAFWVGFAIVGSAYFGFAFFLTAREDSDSPPPLLTTILLEKAQGLFSSDDNTKSTVTASFTTTTTTTTMKTPVTSAIVVYQPLTVTSATTPPPPVPPVPASPPTPTTAVIAPAVAPDPGTQPDTTNSAVAVAVPPTAPAPINGFLTGRVTSPTPLAFPSPLNFQHIGQSMATLILAYVGGLFSLSLAARRERNEANPRPTPELTPSSP